MAPGMRSPALLPALAALLAVPAAFAPAPAVAGDPVVAKTLLESARKSLAAKKYDEAVQLLKRVSTEDPSLIEAVYLRAQALEKLKDDPGALAAYREFLDLFAKKAASGGTTPEEQKLKPPAEKRVAAMAVPEAEFRKLEEKYVADLLAYARDRAAKDPAAALRAANRVLEVAPRNPEALALRDRLGPPKDPGPFGEIETWRDFLKEGAFKAGPGIDLADGVLTIDTKTGGKLRPNPRSEPEGKFAFESEFRVLDVWEETWNLGLSAGETAAGYYGVTISRTAVEVHYGKAGTKPITVASRAMAPLDLAAWHRFGMVARGPALEVWLDGEKVVDVKVTLTADLAGELGISQQGCRAARRVLRMGQFR